VSDWRPYWYGHWVYTDVGWTWASDEPWGWAVYHYGRWFYDPIYGWVWVPGTVWGPAWVDWRWSDDCVGWAPLPPAASWGVWGGLSFHDASVIPARGWNFVEPRSFVAVDLHSRVFPVSRNPMLFRDTRDVTWIGVHNGRPMNTGVAVSAIERRTGRRVDRLTVVDEPTAARGRGQPQNQERIGFYRPDVRRLPGTVSEGRNRFAGRGAETAMRTPGSQPPQTAPRQQSPQWGHWQRPQPESRDRSHSPTAQQQPGQPRAYQQDHAPRAQSPPQRWGQEHAPRPAPQPTPDQRVAQRHGPQPMPDQRVAQRHGPLDHGDRAPDAGQQGGHDHRGHDKGKGKGESG
jgi:hypothetical protein